MSIRITKKDGYWYIDVRHSQYGRFKPDSRHASLHSAICRAELIGNVPLLDDK